MKANNTRYVAKVWCELVWKYIYACLLPFVFTYLVLIVFSPLYPLIKCFIIKEEKLFDKELKKRFLNDAHHLNSFPCVSSTFQLQTISRRTTI